MEAETIDLTDPFEKYLQQNNWTAEGLNERLSVLARTGTNLGDSEQKNITLDELLGKTAKSLNDDLRIFNSSDENLNFESTETIILSDDEPEVDLQIQEKSEFDDHGQVIDISDDEIQDKNETKKLSDLSDDDNEDDLFEEFDDANDSTKEHDKFESETKNSLCSDTSHDVLSSDGDILQSELNVSIKRIHQDTQTKFLNFEKNVDLLDCQSPKLDTNDLNITAEKASLEECQIKFPKNTDSCEFEINTRINSTLAIIETQHLDNNGYVHSIEVDGDQAQGKIVLPEKESGKFACKDQLLTNHAAVCATETNTLLPTDSKNKDSLLLELDKFIRSCTPDRESSSDNTLNDNKTNMLLEIDNEDNHHSEMEELDRIGKDKDSKEIEVTEDGIIQADKELIKDCKSGQNTISEITINSNKPEIITEVSNKELITTNLPTKLTTSDNTARIKKDGPKEAEVLKDSIIQKNVFSISINTSYQQQSTTKIFASGDSLGSSKKVVNITKDVTISANADNSLINSQSDTPDITLKEIITEDPILSNTLECLLDVKLPSEQESKNVTLASQKKLDPLSAKETSRLLKADIKQIANLNTHEDSKKQLKNSSRESQETNDSIQDANLSIPLNESFPNIESPLKNKQENVFHIHDASEQSETCGTSTRFNKAGHHNLFTDKRNKKLGQDSTEINAEDLSAMHLTLPGNTNFGQDTFSNGHLNETISESIHISENKQHIALHIHDAPEQIKSCSKLENHDLPTHSSDKSRDFKDDIEKNTKDPLSQLTNTESTTLTLKAETNPVGDHNAQKNKSSLNTGQLLASKQHDHQTYDIPEQLDTFKPTNPNVSHRDIPIDGLDECIEIADSKDEKEPNEIEPLCKLPDVMEFSHALMPGTIEASAKNFNLNHIHHDSSDESKATEVVTVAKFENAGEKNVELLLSETKEPGPTLRENTLQDSLHPPQNILQLVKEPENLIDSFQEVCNLRGSDNIGDANATLNISADKMKTSDNKSLNPSEEVDNTPQVFVEGPTCSSKQCLLEDTNFIPKNSMTQKCSIKDISKNNKDSSLEESTANDNDSFNVEDVRQQLKLQLSNLRTKRKMDLFQRKSPLIDTDRDETEKAKTTFFPPHHETLLNPSILTKNKDSEAEITINVPSNLLKGEQDSHTNACVSMVSEKQKGTPAMSAEIPIMNEKSSDEIENDTVPEAFQALRKIISNKKLKVQKDVSMDSTCCKDYSIKYVANIFPAKQSVFSAKPIRVLDIPNYSLESQAKESQDKKDIRNFTSGKNCSKLQTNADNPFVSNTLDEFLTDAKLNVSYTIPKCDAEEGLQKDYFAAPVVPYHSEVKEDESEKLREEPKYKPKTLAEKRRILEKKKKTDERRMKKQKAQEDMQTRSYVLFKNKKVFLHSKMIGKCLAYIESTLPTSADFDIRPRIAKPSLLTELHKKETSPVKYRPGPLCKKYLLQQDYAQWNSELKPLPTVVLNVMPEMGKPVHPNLLPIVNHWSGEITNDQVEYALSALKPNREENLKVFQFDLQYENRQDSLLVRKKNPDEKAAVRLQHYKSLNIASSGCSITEEVNSVINNLLNYVEVKQLAPTLLREDEARDDGYENSFPPNKTILGKRRRSKKKISKTNRELIRLSCKVVRMEVKESTEVENCLKPHCKLGCVCKSLRCETLITNLHCRKAQCIFGCLCPKELSKIITISEPTLSASTDLELLSTDTVNRIEDEAKKYLAREEKEFTQTIICANDKTIVVGVANKPRRAARAPKKYTDFFAEDDTQDEPIKKKPHNVKPCVVEVEKWDFSNIEPYCLVHHLYNCHCKGLDSTRDKDKASYEKPSHPVREHKEWLPKVKQSQTQTKVSLEKSKAEETYVMESTMSRRVRKIKKTYSSDFIFYDDQDNKQEKRVMFKSEESKLPEEVIPDYCARTGPIKKKYHIRKVHDEGVCSNDFVSNITEADLFKIKIIDPDNMTDADILKKDILDQRARIIGQLESNKKKHQRKQNLEKRKEDCEAKAIDREKSKIKPVFKGEIIINDSEWLKKISNKPWTTDCYARILPWHALLIGFTMQTINVYCISDLPLRLMLGVGKKLSISRIMDIEAHSQEILETPLRGRVPWLVSQSQNVRDIIKWLHAGSLSSKYNADSLSFLLVETVADHFEVRGLCTQKTTASGKQVYENEKGLDDLNAVEDIAEIKHKDLNHEIKFLFVLKCQFKLRELVEEGFDDDHTDSLYMWVGLPEVYKVAKWRMIFLNHDFAYLFFNKIKYSIKYMDLVKLTELAKESQRTLIIRNLAIRRCYTHNMYGLYVSPKYADRVFVGPYFINDYEEDVSTLKYMNESLISSEAYSKMTGDGSTNCGHWMHERPYQQKPKRYLSQTVDLTREDEPEGPTSSKKKMYLETRQQPSPDIMCNAMDALSCANGQVIYQYGQKVLIKNATPRAPTEFNRFIVTNIPHFGYLGAFQPANSTKLEVSWPFEKKVLEFKNADKARDFLQERFNQLLQPVPDTFKIQVIVLVHLDLTENQPINAEHLNGHCICGFFGTYNINDISDDFCRRKLNMSKEEIGHLFIKRAEVYIAKRIEDLAQVTGIDPKDEVNYNVKSILERARDQIKQQERIRINLSAQIHSKELEVISNIKKVFKMIKDLPEHQRNIEARIINDILRIRPHRLGSNETIMINDDDSPTTSNSASSVNTLPLKAKEPHSSMSLLKPENVKKCKRKAAFQLKHEPPAKKIIKVNSLLGSGSSTTISQPNATITSQISYNC